MIGNLLASVDVETTGRRAGWHEIVQIGILPLNADIRPLEGVTPFYTTMRPEYPERAEPEAFRVNGLNLDELRYAPEADRVEEMLLVWLASLDLPMDRKLVPLAQNWAFESGFIQSWLGVQLKERIFMGIARDTMTLALGINDRAALRGQPAPFEKVNLDALCTKLGVVNEKAHDALSDARAEAEVYRGLLLFNG